MALLKNSPSDRAVDWARGPGEIRTGLLLLLCFVLAQADQQVMGLLAVLIQDDLRLTNSELGLLQGFAFSMAYAVAGLVMARFADSGSRIAVASACVALWSISTICCGFANSFLVLFLFRAVTAATEAGLPPAAFSIFGQSGEIRRAARMTSVFMLAPFIGGGLVFMLGGALLSANQILVAASIKPWRVVFLSVGLPGLILAPLLRKLGSEPSRSRLAEGDRLPPLGTVVSVILSNSFLHRYFAALTAFYMLVAVSAAWYPAVLIRTHRLSTAAAGGLAGGIYLTGGVLGVIGSNLRASFARELTLSRMVRDFFVAAVTLIPTAILMGKASALWMSLLAYAIYAFLSAWIISAMVVPIQLNLDDRMRGRGAALASLCMSAIAGSSGPWVVGALIDRWGLSLSSAFAITGAAAITMASVLFLAAALSTRVGAEPVAA
jgi:MFS family permease